MVRQQPVNRFELQRSVQSDETETSRQRECGLSGGSQPRPVCTANDRRVGQSAPDTLIPDGFARSIAMTRFDAGEIGTLEIRPFRPSDLNDVIRLWRSCNLTRPWNDPSKDIARKLRVNPEWFLVAALGEEIVGSVMIG